MAYTDHFKIADDLVTHLDSVIGAIADPFLASRYTGFVAVAAVTVYELALKEVLCTFGDKKHPVLGNFTRAYFDQINGRIKYKSLHERYVAAFGDKYVKRFRKEIERVEKATLQTKKKSILTSYDNIITWRHQFAHEGQIPTSATYKEAVEAYQTGKSVIDCLATSMRR